jgi:hypothetical protein
LDFILSEKASIKYFGQWVLLFEALFVGCKILFLHPDTISCGYSGISGLMVEKSSGLSSLSSIKGLGADGPDPDLKEKLMLFGQFVGDWDILKARYTKADGTEVKMKGEVHFGWILGGKAIQDVWMGSREGSKKVVLFGTTIRFYDPKIDAWRSTWLSPIKGLVQAFIGRKINDEIVLESRTTEGYPEKWIFSEITPQSFRWHSEETHDDGKTWLLTEEMQIRKVLSYTP